MAVEVEKSKMSFIERAPDIYFYSTLVAHLLELIWSIASAAVASAMVYECPAETMIPISLIVLSAVMLVDAALFLSRNRVHRNHTFRAVQLHNLASGVIAILVVSFLVATMTFLAITEADHSDLNAGNYCNFSLCKFAFSTCVFAMLVLFFFKRNPFPCSGVLSRGRVRLESERESRGRHVPVPDVGGVFP